MIFSLRGTVAYVNKQTVGVETAAGIGYEVTLARVSGIARGQEIYLYTYFKVSDSSQELFGSLISRTSPSKNLNPGSLPTLKLTTLTNL